MADNIDRESKDYFEYMRIVLKGKQDPSWFIETQLGVSLFPMQRTILTDFYSGNYRKFLGACGMRSGKSALGAMMCDYELFSLLVLDNPSTHYGLLPNQPIFISAVATSEDQAIDSIFANARNMVEESDFFNTWTNLRIRDTEVICSEKNVTMKTLSSWSSTAVGRSNKAVIFDELDNFEETSGKRGAYEIFTRLSKSTDTFGKDGHVFAISSLKSPTSIMMTLYNEAISESNSSTLAILKPTWEMNPHLTREALMAEHKFNMAAFYRDYACQPQASTGMEFPEKVKLDVTLRNLLVNFPTKPDTSVDRVLAIDPAVKNDGFGMACGYMNYNENIVVDGVTLMRKFEGEVFLKPSEVKAVVTKAIELLNINTLVFDTWMFPELIEYVEERYGITTVKHIVHKEDYDRWREGQDKIRVVYDEGLQLEANQLVVKSDKKVDHPFSGGKDMADCVANVIWYWSVGQHIEDSNKKEKQNKVRLIPLASY